MGTRNLTVVIKDGQPRIAQYGQWDGYPSGQGQTALNFLKSGKLDALVANLDKITFDGQAEIEAYLKEIGAGDGWMDMEQADKFNARFPFLGRDHGAAVLDMIADYEGDEPIILRNQIDFAADSLFCEYAYVIDLDKEMFEAYVGFQTSAHTDGRFASMGRKPGEDYYPVRLAAAWPFAILPDFPVFESIIEGVSNYYRQSDTSDRDLPAPGEPWDVDEYGPTPLVGPVIVHPVVITN